MQMIPCLRSPDESYSILTIDKINSMPAAGHADGSEGVKFNIVMKFDSEKLIPRVPSLFSISLDRLRRVTVDLNLECATKSSKYSYTSTEIVIVVFEITKITMTRLILLLSFRYSITWVQPVATGVRPIPDLPPCRAPAVLYQPPPSQPPCQPRGTHGHHVYHLDRHQNINLFIIILIFF